MQVSNAQEELLQWHAENAKGNTRIIHATERCAAGIIQAIGHFKLGPNMPPRDIADFSDYKLENPNPGHEVVKFFLFYEKWRRAEVENSAVYLASLKADCVCLLSSFLLNTEFYDITPCIVLHCQKNYYPFHVRFQHHLEIRLNLFLVICS